MNLMPRKRIESRSFSQIPQTKIRFLTFHELSFEYAVLLFSAHCFDIALDTCLCGSGHVRKIQHQISDEIVRTCIKVKKYIYANSPLTPFVHCALAKISTRVPWIRSHNFRTNIQGDPKLAPPHREKLRDDLKLI